MIKKIRKIKNLGMVFSDFRWDLQVSDFKRFNLIYGWNGCGKTTLTRLFTFLNLVDADKNKYPDLQYQVETVSATVTQGEVYSVPVRVFNKDFITNNVSLLECKAKPIFILGEENRKLADQIQQDEQLLQEKLLKQENCLKSKEKAETAKAKIFTDIARVISTNATGDAIRKYNKRNAEDAFGKIKSKALLEDSQIGTCNLTLKQIEKQELSEFIVDRIEGQTKDAALLLGEVVMCGKKVVTQTVDTVVIERLKMNSDISEWVENGLLLHNQHKSSVCEFCAQQIPSKRIKELKQYFNDADRKMKEKIDNQVDMLRDIYHIISKASPIDKANCYEELQQDFQKAVQLFKEEKSKLLSEITVFGKHLKEKKMKTTEIMEFNCDINYEPFGRAIESINIIIRKHNLKTINFVKEKHGAQQMLEKHYLSTVYDQIEEQKKTIKDIDQELLDLHNGKQSLKDDIGIGELKIRIETNRAKISSSAKACKEINKQLRTFLGRDEIVFEVCEEGYIIKRNKEIAFDLSEGEKTAIAFVYYVVQLNDMNFDVTDGIVVIDDPVSSLDSNSLFQAFSFMINAIKDAKQVFILTHNYEFLRLVINWMEHVKDRAYYMIKNSVVNDRRAASIEPLDRLLVKYESEYLYLFSLLKSFVSDGGIERVYPMPNIARKLLDTFLMFRVPNSETMFKKLEKIDYDPMKKRAIYKYVNHESHITGKGFDPALVPESEKVIPYLLDMIKKDSPEHFRILNESVGEVDGGVVLKP